MCPADDSHRTIEFKNYFTITPTILTRLKLKDYLKLHSNIKLVIDLRGMNISKLYDIDTL